MSHFRRGVATIVTKGLFYQIWASPPASSPILASGRSLATSLVFFPLLALVSPGPILLYSHLCSPLPVGSDHGPKS